MRRDADLAAVEALYGKLVADGQVDLSESILTLADASRAPLLQGVVELQGDLVALRAADRSYLSSDRLATLGVQDLPDYLHPVAEKLVRFISDSSAVQNRLAAISKAANLLQAAAADESYLRHKREHDAYAKAATASEQEAVAAVQRAAGQPLEPKLLSKLLKGGGLRSSAQVFAGPAAEPLAEPSSSPAHAGAPAGERARTPSLSEYFGVLVPQLPSKETQACADLPSDHDSGVPWSDGASMCTTYATAGWCAKYGKTDYNGAGTAASHCCACGGGRRSAPTPEAAGAGAPRAPRASAAPRGLVDFLASASASATALRECRGRGRPQGASGEEVRRRRLATFLSMRPS